jgi:hypothetical protein
LKSAAADKQAGLRVAINKLADVREQLSAMRAAAAAADSFAFDQAQTELDSKVGYAASDPNNPIGHVLSGSSGARSLSIDLGDRGAVYYETQALGSRYRLDIAGSAVGDPNLQAQTVSIDGVDVAFSGINFISRAGNDITFDDGTTTYTATYTPGGVGVASAFIYNNFATAPEQTQAIADIDAAMTAVARIENSLTVAEAQVKAGVKTFEFKLEQLGIEFKAAYDGELSAREAELKAAQTSFDLANSQIALLGKVQVAQAELLLKRRPSWDLDVTSILSTRLSLKIR